MSMPFSAITVFKKLVGSRNHLSDWYFRFFHTGITRRLNARGLRHYKLIELASKDGLPYVTDEERKAIITLADKTIANSFNLLGSGDKHLNPVPWSTDFISGHEWLSGTYYKKYCQVDLHQHFDVKIPRELSRFHFLLHLVLAFQFTKEEKYLAKAKELVLDWIEKNPLMYSINWGCTMDVGLRAINWIWGLSLCGKDSFDEGFTNKVSGSLYQHGWFIYRNFEGHCFRSNNNHYYSDLAGLLHIAALFKGDEQADEWYGYALHEFYRETRTQILPSGMDYEGSTNYHRLVLEILLTTLIMLKRTGEDIPSDIWFRCEQMFDTTYHLLMPNGEMPIVGDQDNGRCLPWGADGLNDYRYLMSVGAFLFGRDDFKVAGNGFNVYCAIFGGEKTYDHFMAIEMPMDKRQSMSIRDAGFVLMRHSRDYLLFNCDNQGLYRDSNTTLSHTHSDWFSFVLCADGIPFIIDPGTHVYSSDALSRNIFRGTAMHNTIVIDGQNQSEVYEKKLWDMRRKGRVELLRWKSDDKKDEIACCHNGYGNVMHQRGVMYDKAEEMWVIDDLLTGEGEHCYEAHFHLDDGVIITHGEKSCLLEKSGKRLQFTFDSDSVFKVEIKETFLSKSYGLKEGGKEIVVAMNGSCPVTLHTTISKQ